MYVHYKIEHADWMRELRPTRTVQHSYVQLVIVLNGLHHKASADVVDFIDLRFVMHAIVFRANDGCVVWPELRRLLKRTKHGKNSSNEKYTREYTTKLTASSSGESNTIVCAL